MLSFSLFSCSLSFSFDYRLICFVKEDSWGHKWQKKQESRRKETQIAFMSLRFFFFMITRSRGEFLGLICFLSYLLRLLSFSFPLFVDIPPDRFVWISRRESSSDNLSLSYWPLSSLLPQLLSFWVDRLNLTRRMFSLSSLSLVFPSTQSPDTRVRLI